MWSGRRVKEKVGELGNQVKTNSAAGIGKVELLKGRVHEETDLVS